MTIAVDYDHSWGVKQQNKHTNKQANRQTDRQTDRKTDRKTDKQTNIQKSSLANYEDLDEIPHVTFHQGLQCSLLRETHTNLVGKHNI